MPPFSLEYVIIARYFCAHAQFIIYRVFVGCRPVYAKKKMYSLGTGMPFIFYVLLMLETANKSVIYNNREMYLSEDAGVRKPCYLQ